MSRTYRRKPILKTPSVLVVVRYGKRKTAVSPLSSAKYALAKTGKLRHRLVEKNRLEHAVLVRESQTDVNHVATRDEKAAGFREHRQFRNHARQALKKGDDNLTAGKKTTLRAPLRPVLVAPTIRRPQNRHPNSVQDRLKPLKNALSGRFGREEERSIAQQREKSISAPTNSSISGIQTAPGSQKSTRQIQRFSRTTDDLDNRRGAGITARPPSPSTTTAARAIASKSRAWSYRTKPRVAATFDGQNIPWRGFRSANWDLIGLNRSAWKATDNG